MWPDPSTGELSSLGGTQRLRLLSALENEGFEIPKVPVNRIEAKSLKEAKRILLSLASQYGKFNQDGLLEFVVEDFDDLKEVQDEYSLMGVDYDAIAESHGPNDPAKDAIEDEVPEVPKVAKTKLGDVYELGEHRLMCGDSTSEDVVAELMNEAKADMVFTDPPYGVNYDGGHVNKNRRTKLANDHDTTIYDGAVPNMEAFSKPTAALYLWFAATKSLQVLQVLQVLQECKYEIRSWLIWNKNKAQFGAIGAQYKQKHEPCLYAYKKGHAPFWDGPNNEVSVWDEARASRNEFHPTQKPVRLSSRAITNSCPKSGSVLDLFGGSGATLIACEKTKRKCFMMELDPLYCDVIVDRWLKYTGKTEYKLNGKIVKVTVEQTRDSANAKG